MLEIRSLIEAGVSECLVKELSQCLTAFEAEMSASTPSATTSLV
jgi:hypothetical protein